MKISEHLVGKFVAVQLARPVCLHTYGAHVRHEGKEHLVAQPILAPTVSNEEAVALQAAGQRVPMKAQATETIPHALIGGMFEDSVTLVIFDPQGDGSVGHVIEKIIHRDLILGIDLVTGFEQPMPQAAQRQRQSDQPKVTLR